MAYGSPVKKVAELILEAANATPQVLQDPLPVVTFEDFGDNSLAFELTFWVESTVERGIKVARSDIRFRIDELFEKNEIVIAFPQRDIHLDGSLKLIRQKD